MKRRWGYVAVAVVVVIALFAVAGCLQRRRGGPAGALSGDVTNFSMVHLAGPTEVATATPVLMVDSDGVSNILEIRDAATPVAWVKNGGVAVLDGGAEVNGTITLENDETIVNSTNDVVAIAGMVGLRQYVIDKAASYTPTLAESGALFTNDGASGAITFTLPSPSLGQVYGFIAQDDHDIFLHPASGDQILSETNAADDDLGQATQYGVIWIVSDGTDWLPVSVIGTWDDEDG